MPTEWLDVWHEDMLTRIAMVEGYSLTIVGGRDWWLWFIDLNGQKATEGMAHRLDAATAAAKNTARRLARDHAGDAKRGGT